jgi:hypothetical protein
MRKLLNFSLIKIFVYSLLLLIACNNSPEPARQVKVPADTVTSVTEINAFATTDQSPMDMSYFPPSYPLQKMKGRDSIPLVARIIYSRPHKKGRVIFGESSQSLCQYGRPWRLGANEASEIEFFRDVKINGGKVSEGRYIIYCIPHKDKWTIKLNTNLYTWGLQIDSTMDVFKTDIPILDLNPPLEDFTMVFLPAKKSMELLMAWDNVKALLPVTW